MLKNKKSLGQNWLTDRKTLLEIAEIAYFGTLSSHDSNESDEACNDRPEERSQSKLSHLCLEIGPGLGTLTSALFKYFDRIISVEFDENLAANLPKSFPGKNLEVIHADILDYDLGQLPKDYAVAGNIPYYITSPIVQKFLHAENKPSKITLLVQKEVAQRLAAGQGDYSILGLSAQIYAKVSLGPVIKRNLFTPPPKVDSQVVILEPRSKPKATEKTMALIKLGFSSPRKKLATNLSVTLRLPRNDIYAIFKQLGIPENARPADLSINDWVELHELVI
ncbi:16S rRNA (adenine(1518)-N(6)/adenine(1519)-N(6))-dimethyltransferase RsmA [Candidatus Saccharibacteria bacterium]|nr:16S rRNA (adenine(1518)-N(6)/adenine(1519)-N(6))-dimethyltransferase RsmA [Candidatus Saccharibacteria bacterium]